MSIVQWFVLILVIAVVAGAYWYLRRHAGGDPWQGMEDPGEPEDAEDLGRGESLGGDSYIVGVRTLSRGTPGDRKAASQQAAADEGDTSAPPPEISDEAAEASWSAYKNRSPQPEHEPENESPRAPEPPTDPAPEPPAEQPARAAAHERVEDIRAPRTPVEEQEVFILHVASPDGRFFDGPEIHAALADAGLKFGLNDIYHRVTETHGVPESVFAVASMLKPGTLDPAEQAQLATPGLTLFLVVPGSVEGVPAMRDMMETANAVAQRLGGEVLDDKRALLKRQTAQYILDQIAEIDRRARVAARRR